MAHQYYRFLEILKKWPVDKLRGDQCFGRYLRDSSKVWFTNDGKVIGSIEKNSQLLDSLEKLANNYYGKKYSTSHIQPVTGFDAAECSKVICEEFVSEDNIKQTKGDKDNKKQPNWTSVD